MGHDDGGMDVALAADRDRIAKVSGNLGELALDTPWFPGGGLGGQGKSGEHGATPGAEVLGGELPAADLSQVLVDVGGIDDLRLALVVDVLEELVTGQLLTVTDHTGQPSIREVDSMTLPSLAAELEAQRGTLNGDVLGAQRREPIGMVLSRVLFVPDSDQRGLEQTDDRGQHLFPRQMRTAEILLDAPTDPGQRTAELDETGILVLVAGLAPARVIPVLLATPGVPAHRLDVAVGEWADPYVRPGGRDGRGFDPAEGREIANRPTVAIQVAEAPASPDPSDAGTLIRHVA